MTELKLCSGSGDTVPPSDTTPQSGWCELCRRFVGRDVSGRLFEHFIPIHRR